MSRNSHTSVNIRQNTFTSLIMFLLIPFL